MYGNAHERKRSERKREGPSERKKAKLEQEQTYEYTRSTIFIDVPTWAKNINGVISN